MNDTETNKLELLTITMTHDLDLYLPDGTIFDGSKPVAAVDFRHRTLRMVDDYDAFEGASSKAGWTIERGCHDCASDVYQETLDHHDHVPCVRCRREMEARYV